MGRSPRENEAARNAATYMALAGLFATAVALLFLVALVVPQALGIVGVVFGFLFFGVFHYLAWGWWFDARRSNPGDSSWDEPAGSDRDEF